MKLTREISLDTIIIIRAETNTVAPSAAVTMTSYGRIWRKGAGKSEAWTAAALTSYNNYNDDDELVLNVLRCQLTY